MATAILTVDQVFSEALQQAAGKGRADYLDIACANNPELRQRVEQLLLAFGDAESFLESPATGVDATIEHTITEQPGTLIGPYKLLQEIGQGGMGVVYMAEQLQPVQRKIALKIIKVGMDTAQVVARFQAERQALALMN